MQIIKERYSLFQQYIGSQEKKNCQYRKSIYTIIQPMHNGKLIYNIMTGELIFDSNQKDITDYLIDGWFYVPCDYNEFCLMSDFKKHCFSIGTDSKGLDFCTVLTTTDCNARCFYCYEKNLKKINMSDLDAKAIAQYIYKNANKDHFVVDWFGGEPLCNIGAIDIFCNYFKEQNANYSTMMISNGYLFNEEIVKKAKNVWKTTRVQITLDGMDEIYAKTKNYLCGDKQAFRHVIENIKLLIKNEIHAEIRLNVDSFNLEDIKELVHYLVSEFKGCKYMNVYLHFLFSNHDGFNVKHDDDEWKTLTDSIIELETLLFDNDLFECSLPKKPKMNACLADNPSACTIMPSGDILRCRDFLSAVPEGNAITGIINDKITQDWKELLPTFEKCQKCFLYPECNRLVMCTEHHKCNDITLNQKINRIQLSIIEEYNNSHKAN